VCAFIGIGLVMIDTDSSGEPLRRGQPSRALESFAERHGVDEMKLHPNSALLWQNRAGFMDTFLE
jgi:hypothetical protein